MNKYIKALKDKVEDLRIKAERFDKALPKYVQKELEVNNHFNFSLFIQDDNTLSQCCIQLKSNVNRLQGLVDRDADLQLIQGLCNIIEMQFSAINKAINSKDVLIRDFKFTKLKNEQIANNTLTKFNWIKRKVMTDSRSLYLELEKHKHWEEELNEKFLVQKQLLESVSKSTKKFEKAQKDLFATNGRLNQCRQAITFLQERLKLFNKTN